MDTENDKIDDLSERIRNAKTEAEARPENPPANVTAGRNVGLDFVGSIAVCGVVGALADRAFKTSPWLLLGMVLFGFIVGMVNAWRAIQK